eukprot:jgi/Chrzof1/586/Cz01g21100.t1
MAATPYLALRHRELGCQQKHQLHFSEALARKLSLDTSLQGHSGCVNRLAWNEDGSRLASASDDCQVLLWHYPDTDRMPLAVQTEHRANLFGVQFLPSTDNTKIVSGAMDYTVQLHELDGCPSYKDSCNLRRRRGTNESRRSGAAQHETKSVQPRTTVYHCHKSRVKDVEVAPGDPNIFWSAGEDGMVRQFDRRLGNQKVFESPNVLISVAHHNKVVELKALDINKTCPYYMAVACGDPYVRIYDRRKLATSAPQQGSSTPAMLQLAPPHLPVAIHGRMINRAHATYVNFSNRGDKVVATYHGDHAYCFDVTSMGTTQAVYASPTTSPTFPCSQTTPDSSRQRAALQGISGWTTPGCIAHHQGSGSNGVAPSPDSMKYCNTPCNANNLTVQSGHNFAVSEHHLPEAAERAKLEGNSALFEKKWAAAVTAFTHAIKSAPWAPVLYAQRALALLQRSWEGDAAFALRDCDTAISLEQQSRGPAMMKAIDQAYYRRIHAFKALGQYKCALLAYDDYCRRYPDRSGDELARLHDTLQRQLAERRRRHEAHRQQQERRHKMRLQLQHDRRERLATGAAAAAAAAQHRASGDPAIGLPADVGPSAPHMMDSEEERDHEAFRDQDHARRYEVGYVSDGSDDAADGARSGEDDDDGDDGDHNAGDGDGMHNHDGDDDGGVSCMDSDPDDEPLLKHYGSSFGSQDVAADRTQGEASTSSSSSSNSSRKTTWGSRSSSRQNVSAEQMSSIGRTSGLPYSSTSAGWWGSTPGGRRLLARYIGHCNVQTDIKESVFVGHGDQMVACGSDDGRVFIYDADTGVPVKVLDADDDVANCVQCHPAQPVLATSGIEQVVKLWSPLGSVDDRCVDGVVSDNQQRMRDGPTLLRNVHPAALQAALEEHPELFHMLVQRVYGMAAGRGNGREDGQAQQDGQGHENGDEDDGDDNDGAADVSCRMS